MGGREAILKVHTKKIPLAEDVDISVLARGTPGFSGADLANLVNEAALFAARQNKRLVDMLWGHRSERRSDSPDQMQLPFAAELTSVEEQAIITAQAKAPSDPGRSRIGMSACSMVEFM